MPSYCNKITVMDGNSVIREIDLSQDTVASANHIMSGYYGHLNTGERVLGTGQGGGTPSATQHVIEFELENSTVTINAYYDSAWISDAITATKPTEYNGQTVASASLDGVAWYEAAAIPLNEQLIDFTAIVSGTALLPDGTTEEYEWRSTSDYTLIDPSMTFAYIGGEWDLIAFYTSAKTPISTIEMHNDATSISGGNAHGTLTPAKIPASAAYVRITSDLNPTANNMSLIRTA